jgi:hypothetical protein
MGGLLLSRQSVGARLAVEHRTSGPGVVGSNPARPSRHPPLPSKERLPMHLIPPKRKTARWSRSGAKTRCESGQLTGRAI